MSELKVDTLTGKTSAGDITVTSEGGAATMQLQQGLANFWVNVASNQTTVNDSLNMSSVSDGGVGQAIFTFINSFSQNPFDYGAGGMTQPNNAGFSRLANQSSTSSIGNNVRNSSNDSADHQTMISLNGGLA